VVTAVVTAFLDQLDLEGADVVRAQLALLVAAELDSPDTPKHSIPRLTAQLRTLVIDLEKTPRTNGRTVLADAREFLAAVTR
jgi:hypothetical protein